jgi:DNA-3-methyladenine glycosylase I
LSWDTILRKREGYRRAFAGFDPRLVAKFTEADVERLVGDAGIVRHRGKISSAINNARLVLEIQSEFGSLDAYLWQFTDGRSIQNNWATLTDLPARTTESDAMSKALKSRGFKFVGSTVCYALMQAIGMVNDHTTDCFRHSQLG